MVILNELGRALIIESLTQPIPLRFHWIMSGQQMDFTLSEINYLEETVGPTITLIIADSEVVVPASWNILIVDRETYTIDFVPVTATAAFSHLAFVFSPDDCKLITEEIRVGGWVPKASCIYPAIEKANALAHVITSGLSHGKQIQRCVIVGPNDLHRYVSGCTVGDLLG